MTASVKRDYRSELRAAQALETRRSIVAAASKLFVEDGYGATTIDAVAEAAGVSRKTVFTAVGGKLDLLKVALDWAVAGDDRPVAVADRGEMRQIMAEDDAVVLLRGCARVIVAITGRAAGLAQALEVAAGMDPAACDLVEQARRHRLDDARMVVGRLRALGALTQRPHLRRGGGSGLAGHRPRAFRPSGPGAWVVPWAIREVAVAVSDRAIDQHIVQFSYMPQRACNALVNAAIDVLSMCSHRSRALSRPHGFSATWMMSGCGLAMSTSAEDVTGPMSPKQLAGQALRRVPVVRVHRVTGAAATPLRCPSATGGL